MDNSTIKKNLETYRERRHISQTEMALLIETSRNSYRQMEKGDTMLINDKLPRIASVLGVSTEELILGYEPVQASEWALKASDNHAEQLHALTREYEERLQTLQDEITVRDTCINSLKDNVEHLKSIIRRQEKELSGK